MQAFFCNTVVVFEQRENVEEHNNLMSFLFTVELMGLCISDCELDF